MNAAMFTDPDALKILVAFWLARLSYDGDAIDYKEILEGEGSPAGHCFANLTAASCMNDTNSTFEDGLVHGIEIGIALAAAVISTRDPIKPLRSIANDERACFADMRKDHDKFAGKERVA